jgi:membrane-associated phospholipid phosphatase
VQTNFKNCVVTSLFLFFIMFHSIVSGQDLDSTDNKKLWYKTTAFKTLAVPTAMIGYGISTIGHGGLFYSSKEAQKDITLTYPGFHTSIDNHIRYAPVAAVFALNFVGVKGKHNVVDVAILYALSHASTGAVTSLIKHYSGVLRPDGSNYYSFPSGHTSSAFVASEVMHQEFKDVSIWYSVAAYSTGIATGAMRMMNNKHWLSDVFAGAGIGILVTKATYLYYPWFQEKVLRNKTKNIGLSPVVLNKGLGVVFVYAPK